jgi:hypothetical protein
LLPAPPHVAEELERNKEREIGFCMRRQENKFAILTAV